MRYYAFLVSDSEVWIEGTLASWNGLPAVGEPISWAEARDLQTPPAALALDVRPPVPQKLEWLSERAGMGWQSLSVCWLSAFRGAAKAASEIESSRYTVVLPAGPEDARREELQSHLQTIVESRSWLVPRVLDALGCRDPAAGAALRAALEMIPASRTVEKWAKPLGFRRREELPGLFRALGLPRPKLMLEWLRLLRVVEYARHVGCSVTRRELAREFNYADGDYLARVARNLTGVELEVLIELGVDGTLELLVRRFEAE